MVLHIKPILIDVQRSITVRKNIEMKHRQIETSTFFFLPMPYAHAELSHVWRVKRCKTQQLYYVCSILAYIYIP